MTDELKKEILQLIKENLTIDIIEEGGYGSKNYIHITLDLDGEVISSDTFSIRN